MNSYITAIVVCCLIDVFVGVLVPDGVIKKSVLMVISLLIIYELLMPLLNLLNNFIL